jgi:anti-sigma-K factor RskA
MSGRAFTAHDYVLGELSESERDEAERLLRDDAEFAAEVDRLRPVVARLEEVPADVWEGIPPLEAAPATPPPTPAAAPRRRIFGLRPAFAAGLATAAAAVIVAVVLFAASGGDEEPTLILAAVPGSGAEATGSAQLGGAGDTATVELAGLEPSRSGEFYELWLLNDADDLVSLGSFRVGEGGDAEIELPIPIDPSEYSFLDISVEPDDGDASHSGDSVLRGPVSAS